MRFFKFTFFIFILTGCQSIQVPDSFTYNEVETSQFKIATWQKITGNSQTYKIYIEGDGYAFDRHGQPTQNPTPKGTLLREIAFNDYNDNVIYVARPCQYVKEDRCIQKYWSKARFSQEVINAIKEVIIKTANGKDIVLIGFSGGAQVAGLVAAQNPNLKIKKIITIAGNLDHKTWVEYHKLPYLEESLDLSEYRKIYTGLPQVHYVGEDDDVIPKFITEDFIKDKNKIIIVPHATHTKGYQKIYNEIWKEI